jgi:hypothetical protein
VTPLTGLKPWLRARDGNYRIFLRPLTDDELTLLEVELPDTGFLVGRVVDKKDAKRVLKQL